MSGTSKDMTERMRGVNLGGWLVLERWITPSVFRGTMAQDETQLCNELGVLSAGRLEEHRSTFITEEDIKWIKDEGLNAIRVPVPHWVFGNVEPYVGCVKYLDWLMDTALKHKLQVIIDFHAAPGSQNGNDHSGLKGKIGWPEDGNITRSLDFIEQLAERYCKYPNLAGIELLNEPSNKIPKKVLTEYYRLGYERVRQYCDRSIAVIISDTFDPENWKKVLTEYEYTWLDTHLYQCFSDADKKRGIHNNIKKAKYEWHDIIQDIQKVRPVMVGEWSLSLDRKSFRGLDSFERDKALQAYGQAQLHAFEQAAGWFYWTYKTEEGGTWSLRDSIQRGWLNLATITS
jgi:glucan 1,3-beta-glucosidase